MPDDPTLVIERCAAAAWPAAVTETEPASGWLLRATPGMRGRRANSTLPVLPDGPPPAARPDQAAVLGAVERFYRSRRLPVRIQVSPADRHTGLDAALAARGYRKDAPVLVMTAPARDVADLPRRAASDVAVRTVHRRGQEWDEALLGHDARADTPQVLREVLSRVTDPAAVVTARVGDRPAGVGLFVAGGAWAGVFRLATDPGHRRRGIAAETLRAGAAWAASTGAHSLYLQVEEENAAAIRLYERTGFTPAHRYHYRVAD